MDHNKLVTGGCAAGCRAGPAVLNIVHSRMHHTMLRYILHRMNVYVWPYSNKPRDRVGNNFARIFIMIFSILYYSFYFVAYFGFKYLYFWCSFRFNFAFSFLLK